MRPFEADLNLDFSLVEILKNFLTKESIESKFLNKMHHLLED